MGTGSTIMVWVNPPTFRSIPPRDPVQFYNGLPQFDINSANQKAVKRLSWELDVRGVLETVGMADEEVWVWDVARAEMEGGRKTLDYVEMPLLDLGATRELELDLMVGTGELREEQNEM